MNSIKECHDCGYRTIAHIDLENCSKCRGTNLEIISRVEVVE